MPNQINTLKNAPGVIAKLAAKMLADKVEFTKHIDRADESDFDGKNGYNSGDTIYVSKPARFVPSNSADITGSIQDIKEEKVPLTLDIRRVVPIALTSKDIATDLSLKSWAKRVLDPAVSAIAQYVDAEHTRRAYLATYNLVGTPGSTVFDMDTILASGQKIDEFACPDKDNRFTLLNPKAQRSAVNSNKGLFQSSTQISDQYKDGVMGQGMGFKFLSNNLLARHTNGNDVAGVQVDTNAVEGSTTLIVKGLTTTTGTVTAGTVFTVAGVNAVHPITKQNLGFAQQFVVITGGTADGNGDVPLTISPAMYTAASGSLQNITTLPVVDMNITVDTGAADATWTQNLAFHKSAYRFASVPLVMPDGLDLASQATEDGITMRVLRDYNILSDQLIMRLDYLGGFTATRPEWGVRITE